MKHRTKRIFGIWNVSYGEYRYFLCTYIIDRFWGIGKPKGEWRGLGPNGHFDFETAKRSDYE